MENNSSQPRFVALSFDIEEFDLPRERRVPISVDRQLEVSSEGLSVILDLLRGMGVRATFFCTAFYAENCPWLISRIVADGHEVASHSYNHSKFDKADLLLSREKLEQLTGLRVRGYRAPRMAEVSPSDLLAAGYSWDSSLNPCFLPGRYNNFKAPVMAYRSAEGLIEIPASVSPLLRLPLFWLSLHNMPLSVYTYLARRALKRTSFLNLYFHPWEFSEQLTNSQFRVPFYITRNSGSKLARRLATFICSLQRDPLVRFVTLSEYVSGCDHLK
ncbi:MAG: polysaccharide deacetylase family protein [Rikenellaceae bacterium]